MEEYLIDRELNAYYYTPIYATVLKLKKVMDIAKKTLPKELLDKWKEAKGSIIFYAERKDKTLGQFEPPSKIVDHPVIHIYDAVNKDEESLFSTLSHEFKHFEQWLKGQLPYEKKPSEIEAYKFEKEMVEIAKGLGFLAAVFIGIIIMAKIKSGRRTV